MLRDGDFLLRQHAFVGMGHAVAEIVAARHARAARGRADRTAGIESREADAGLRHRVQMRRLDDLVAVEPGIAPAQIVRHHQNDIGPVRGGALQGQ